MSLKVNLQPINLDRFDYSSQLKNRLDWQIYFPHEYEENYRDQHLGSGLI